MMRTLRVQDGIFRWGEGVTVYATRRTAELHAGGKFAGNMRICILQIQMFTNIFLKKSEFGGSHTTKNASCENQGHF